jgi:general secretion pathway protein H
VEKNNRGFSLLEIVVVILIIGGILSIAVPKMSFNKVDTKKVIREITHTVKEVRNRAKLYGTTYRLAFRMDQDNQAYWVEKSTTVTYIDKAALEKARNDSKDNFRNEDDENKAPSPFQPDTTFFKKEQKLPRDYIFKLVESGAQDVTYSEGLAYIHFFPQGFIESSLIQIEDPKKNIWSITFNPITGISTILTEAKTLKELNP